MQKQLEATPCPGTHVIVVSQSQPKSVMPKAIPFPVACDPDRVIYKAFGLEPGGWTMFLRGNVIAHYMRLMFSGWYPQMGAPGEDLLQLGGDFIVSADRKLVYAYRSKTPVDRPAPTELVHQLKLAQSSQGAKQS